MVLTAEPFEDGETALLSTANVKALQHQTVLTVTDFVPLQGDKAGLELRRVNRALKESPTART